MRFRIERFTPASRATSIVAGLVLIALIVAPWLTGRANIRLLGEMFSFLALASLWNLLAGYCGLVSVGQQAFVGFGGYMLFALAIFLGMDPLMAIPVAGLLGAVLAAPIGVLLFRLYGAYFAIGSWVFAEVLRLSFAQVSALGGGSGSSLPTSVISGIASSREWREILIYWTGLALAVAALLFVVLLLRSKMGLALTGLRDSEIASESLGINSWLTKMTVYVSVAGLTTMVGSFIFLQKLRISPDAAFSVNDWTAFVIFIAVIGGIGTIEGPIIGTLVFFLLRETLADLGTTYLLVLGALAIVIMLKAPRGIWGIVTERTGISLVPIRRRVVFQ
ncbi:branched-chain amino acid ABC transporter permease [Sinorhizobium sp. BG8]|uniref:branched-chain amino acid ABC transporter permease n=1 Tax=Sinorhizobium sp. BG8 TaxID=2613773 RepID=UPI00193E9477|nr:branched-chain amino acid ABC transporter permease [Sinorhizobium sp. BG8]QRM57785.1 branched-chain amino acid ABC transporter permease [Sinorhizobium sp. BG8]